jgi:hypothetical protein
MITQRLGNFPQVTANSPIAKELRGLKPRHVLVGLQFRVTATLTSGGAGVGPMVSADLDAVLAAIISRVRLYGSSSGDQVNIGMANLRSLFQLVKGQDVLAYENATGSAFIGYSWGSATAKTVKLDVTLPFTDEAAAVDPDWCAPSTDQLRWDSSVEVAIGALTSTAVTGGAVTPSAVTIEIVALMHDAHQLFIAPTLVMREQVIPSDNHQLEAMLPLQVADTRPAIGSGAYSATMLIEKDGKPVADNVSVEALAMAYLKEARAPGGYDPTQRVAPLLFNKRGYGPTDLKPSFGNHTVKTPTGFTSGTLLLRYLRMVQPAEAAKLSVFEGKGNTPRLVDRAVLGGVQKIDGRVAAYFPKWISPAA